MKPKIAFWQKEFYVFKYGFIKNSPNVFWFGSYLKYFFDKKNAISYMFQLIDYLSNMGFVKKSGF